MYSFLIGACARVLLWISSYPWPKKYQPLTLTTLLAHTTARLIAAGIAAPDARGEARLLAQHAFGLTREQLILRAQQPVDPATLEPFVARRERREPLAYLTGERGFHGLTFRVTPAVLIPRPETELLVEVTAQFLQGTETQRPRILDIGTGSGCVAVALAKQLGWAEVWATDISSAALEVARENAARYSLSVRFLQGDLLEALPAGAPFDAIVSNPPYIAPREAPTLAPEVGLFEPGEALFDPSPEGDGLSLYRRLAREVGAFLKPGGLLAVEVGLGQSRAVARLWEEAGFMAVRYFQDLAGIERVVTGRAPDGDDETPRA